VVEVNGESRMVTSGLAAGQTVELWFVGYRHPEANVILVDVTAAIQESDEANNALIQPLPLPTPPPVCQPTATPAG
jgi:hypothetical protein